MSHELLATLDRAYMSTNLPSPLFCVSASKHRLPFLLLSYRNGTIQKRKIPLKILKHYIYYTSLQKGNMKRMKSHDIQNYIKWGFWGCKDNKAAQWSIFTQLCVIYTQKQLKQLPSHRQLRSQTHISIQHFQQYSHRVFLSANW